MDFSPYIMDDYAVPKIATEQERKRIKTMKTIHFLSSLSETVRQRVSLGDFSSPAALVSKVMKSSKEGQAEFLMMYFCSPSFFRKLVQYKGGENKVLFHAFHKFEAKAQDSIKAYNKFVTELEVYLCYVERGGKGLHAEYSASSTKSDALAEIESEALPSLVSSLNHCYCAYYHKLSIQHLLGKDSKVPEVSPELLQHCVYKEWLRPIAHILLIRHAQYQMMNIWQKQSNKDLLHHHSLPLFSDEKGVNPLLDKITYDYCLTIQQVFERWTETYGSGESIVRSIKNNLLKKYHFESETPFISNHGNSDLYKAMQNIRDVNLSLEYNRSIWDVNRYAKGVFFIPFGRFDKIAWTLSNLFGLSYDEYVTLRNILPASILLRGKKNNLPKENASPDDQKTFDTIIRELGRILSPKSYYNLTTKEYNDTEAKLSGAVSFLASKGFLNSWKRPDSSTKLVNPHRADKRMSYVWEFTRKYVKPFDMTLIGLTVSNAISLPYAETLLKNEFPGLEAKRIKKVLHHHMSIKRREILAETPFDKVLLTEISVHAKYLVLRTALRIIIEEKLSATSSLLKFQDVDYDQMAREINNLYSSLELKLTKFKQNNTKVEDQNVSTALALLTRCSEKEKKHLFWYAYEQAVNNFLNILHCNIMSLLFEKAFSDASSTIFHTNSETDENDSASI